MWKENRIYQWIKVLVFNLILFIFLLILGEIAIRIFKPQYEIYARTYPGQYKDRFFNDGTTIVNWPKKDHDLGWVCSNTAKYLKFSNKIYNNLQLEYNINPQGFRYKYDFFKNDSNESKIIMLGDSFLFGVYLKDDETITANIFREFKNRISFVNIGIPGYGIDQMYLTYTKFNEVIKSKIIILFYIDDDIYRTLEAFRITEGMNKPSFRIENNKLVLRKNEKPSLLELIFQKSYFLNVFYKKYSYSQSKNLTEKIFEQLIYKTLKNNQKLLIVRFPTDYQLLNNDSFNNLSFKQLLKSKKIFYYEMFNDLMKLGKEKINKMYLKNDGHLTPYGTKIVAHYIHKFLDKILF